MNHKRILFITDNFPPESNAPAIRTYEHAKVWAKKGYQITILTCFPNYPQGEIYKGYKNKIYDVETIQELRVVRVFSYISLNKGFAHKTLDFLSFFITSFIAGLFIKTDLIIATSPQFFTTWSAFLLSKTKKVPWVFEIRDLWPETIKAIGSINDGYVYRFLEKIELFLYRDADKIVTVTNSFKENLITRNIRPDKIKVVTNGIDKEYFKSNNITSKKVYTIGYIGTHGECQNLMFIAKSLKKFSELNEFNFHFVGDGVKKKELVEFKNMNNLENLHFKNSVPKNEVISELQSCSAVLVPLRNSKTFESVIPSKIFEAAFLKIPIILGVKGESKEIVEKFQLGICYEPEDEISFLDALINIRKFKYSSKNYNSFIKKYSRLNLAVEMLEFIDSKR